MKKTIISALIFTSALSALFFTYTNVGSSSYNSNSYTSNQPLTNAAVNEQNNASESTILPSATYPDSVITRASLSYLPKEIALQIELITNTDDAMKVLTAIRHGTSNRKVIPLIKNLYDVWVIVNPTDALEYTKHLSAIFGDNSFRYYALEKAAAHDLAAAQEWLLLNNNVPIDEQDKNTLALYAGFAENSPFDALQRINEITSPYYKHQLELKAIEVLARKDPAQALAWLESSSSVTQQIGLNDAYVAILSPMIEAEPLQAESIILSLSPSDQKNTLARKYTAHLATTDVHDAVQWAQNIEDKEAYASAMSAALSVLSKSIDTQEDAIEYAKTEKNLNIRERFLTQSLSQIARRDIPSAIIHLSSLSFEEQKYIATSVAYSFSEGELGARRAWLDALPDSSLKEAIRPMISN